MDRETLNVKPVAELLLKDASGGICDSYENGMITWCNELVLHVIELKCTEPVYDLELLNQEFHNNIVEINQRLKKFNARLMPTAAHPWMDPELECKLWPHGQSEIYDRYNQIFDCKGHGWSNLQSMHINLPFYDDEEFAVLHSAARLILPIIPGLSASSAIINGNYTGYHDKRLIYYKNNQKKIPSIVGKVIPEKILSKRQYQKLIYNKIEKDIQIYNADNILDPVWVNSRGIIARFDRGSIEIRIIDLQECPHADLAIASLVIATIKMIAGEKFCSFHEQQEWEVEPLYDLFRKTIKSSMDTVVESEKYLRLLGLNNTTASVREVWRHLLSISMKYEATFIAPWVETIEQILDEGNLSIRLLDVAQEEYSQSNLRLIYHELCDNLEENKLFQKCNLSV